jgi:hypothetical protein
LDREKLCESAMGEAPGAASRRPDANGEFGLTSIVCVARCVARRWARDMTGRNGVPIFLKKERFKVGDWAEVGVSKFARRNGGSSTQVLHRSASMRRGRIWQVARVCEVTSDHDPVARQAQPSPSHHFGLGRAGP